MFRTRLRARRLARIERWIATLEGGVGEMIEEDRRAAVQRMVDEAQRLKLP